MSTTFPTLAEVVNATILRVGQVTGIGAQVYSEDIIAEMVIHKFDVLFDKFDFPEYCKWYEGTLQSDGKCDTDLQVEAIGIYRYKDILGVWTSGHSQPLQQFPTQRLNAFSFASSGGSPRWVESSGDDRVFRVIPFGTAGDSIYVRHKHYPPEILADTNLCVDRQALILGAAYDYLADDGANPGATEKMRNLFNQRMVQLMNDESNFDRFDTRGGASSRHEETSGFVDIG